MDDMLTARRPAPFIVQIEWHGPEVGYAAGVVRDGQPWVLGGALLGTGPTPGQATDNLARAARAARPLSLADPQMHAAIQAARRRQPRPHTRREHHAPEAGQ